MTRLSIIILTIYIFCLKHCVSKKYHNYTLYRGIPVNESHLQFFKRLSDYYDVNFWRDPGMLYMPVEFVISPEDRPAFLEEADKNGLYVTTVIQDVQKAFDMQTVKAYIRRKMDSFGWNDFFRLNDIYQWLRDLTMAFPQDIRMISIGKTYENRDIYAVRILLKGSSVKRSKVFIEGGIHAREWVSPAFVTYLISQILHANSLSNKGLRRIANAYEWYIIPVLNPDGYEYTFTRDRMWRKNRHLLNGHYGVDLNRNFDCAFGSKKLTESGETGIMSDFLAVGVSKVRRNEIYCGDQAFSERESAAMANFVRSNSANMEYYVAFHSYGQYMIIPYAHLTTHEDNYYQVSDMCKEAANEIATRFGTRYSHGTAYDTVGYVTSGVSGCWVKKTFRVPYVVTFELRDSGKHGFALPPNQIMPTCLETLDGVISLLTPRTEKFERLKHKEIPSAMSKQTYNVFDGIVIMFNVFWFIIVRFY